MSDVALLLTDVEGSTQTMERDADLARTLIAEHDEIVAEVTDAHAGDFVRNRSEGDSAFLVFAEPIAAVGCAVELQRRLHARAVPGRPLLRVRMGLHVGRPHRRADQLYGPVVNRCGAVRNLGHGGQVLASSAFVAALAHDLAGVALRDLGVHRLQGLNDSEHIHQVCAPDLPDRFPPLRSPDELRHNLPSLPGRFIGDADALDAVLADLESCRVLTLVGPGGMGKTRLAVETAWRARERFSDGVWMADATGRSGAEGLADVIAAALGVREQPGRRLVDTLADHMAPRRLLLVVDGLDGGEAGGAGVVASLLRGQTSRVLATARAPVGVPDERVRQVEALAVPASGAEAGEVLRAPAVELFVDRLDPAAPGLSLDGRELAQVAEVCRRLEGIPLAIEVAAARARSSSLAAVHGEIAAAPGAVPETGTVHAALAGSYADLGGDEARLFRRVAVFAGGFTLEAAEGICASDDLPEDAVLDAVAGLVDRSLLTVDSASGGVRYRSLQTVRSFAGRRLADAGEGPTVAELHRAWFSELAATCNPELRSGPAAADALEADHDNLRSLLVAAGDDAVVDDHLWVAGLLVDFWHLRGHWGLGLQVLEDLLGRPAQLHHPRAVAASGAGRLAMLLGDYDRADRHLAEAARERAVLLQTLDDQRAEPGADLGVLSDRARVVEHELVRLLLDHCELARLRGELDRAAAFGGEALERARAIGAEAEIDASLGFLGVVAIAAGDLDAAAGHTAETLQRRRATGDRVSAASLLNNLGVIRWMQCRYEEARACFEESLALRRALGDPAGIAQGLLNLAEVDVAQGRPAGPGCDESLAISRELGNTAGAAAALRLQGESATAAGDLAAAESVLDAAVALMDELGDGLGLGSVQLRQARVDRQAGRLDRARDRAEDALRAARDGGDAAEVAMCRAELSRIAAAGGDGRAASRALVAALHPRPASRVAAVEIARAAAEVLLPTQAALARHAVEVAERWSAGVGAEADGSLDELLDALERVLEAGTLRMSRS